MLRQNKQVFEIDAASAEKGGEIMEIQRKPDRDTIFQGEKSLRDPSLKQPVGEDFFRRDHIV